MPASLARRLRRIGLSPTTYTETREQILLKDEQGNTIAQDRMRAGSNARAPPLEMS